MRKKLFIVFCALYNGILIAQGGASAHSDAIHAFDEPHRGNGGSFGIGGFVIMILIFLVALFLWGKSMGSKK